MVKDQDPGTYLSPTYISCDQESGKAFISLSTAAKIAVINTETNHLEKYIALPFNPGGTALCNDSKTLIVTDQYAEGEVHFISLPDGGIFRSIRVGHTPDAIVVTPNGLMAFVANRFSNSVSVIDLKENRIIKNIAVDRDPKALAVSPDGKIVAVANHIPSNASTDQFISARVSLIDVASLETVKEVSLANGSQSLADLVFSNDGKYLYVSHILSRNKLPTTQIERGWINSNALSIIAVANKEYYTTVLLDNFNRGAANPSGMRVSDNGKHLFVALTGVHEFCILDLPELHLKLQACNDSMLIEAPNDLRFLSGIKKRFQ